MKALAIAALLLQTIPVVDDATLPRFEVVSVKPGDPNAFQRGMGFRPNAFFVQDSDLYNPLLVAFGVRPHQLTGIPEFAMRERFTIEARAPEGAARADLPLMVRAMFIDRFKLRYHVERKEEDSYVLVLARRDGRLGPKLRASSLVCTSPAPRADGCGIRNAPGLLNFGGMPFSMLVSMLSNQTGRVVTDQTGLAGNYDVELRFSREQGLRASPDVAQNVADDAPSIFDAVQDQLGLKLEKSKAQVEHIVIDRLEKPEPD